MAAVNLGRKPAPATDAPRAPGALVSAASEAAKMGPAHVEEPVAYDAILLASFGGPRARTTSSRSSATSPPVAGSPRSASRRSPTTTARSAASAPSTSRTAS
ncbi:hypothetical protein BC477_00200 [Clavibacter michiganensis subsp. michiganensis]|uniref:Uncharacterized protein n=1 Tax=Clavibacter michiganensis subsp. michiganensis TaxID=33013 RepID=A0A251XFU4_CLAMM|nr:hypothetical protein BC477_00200 [Clavibacter michiganensis subsp. michiganensis]OUE01005.1 hypothetical protein CMMCAS07_16315 [Clavibacter michiganensis subsp. michiganensis]